MSDEERDELAWQLESENAVRAFFLMSGAFEQDVSYDDFNEAYINSVSDWMFSHANHRVPELTNPR